MTWVISYSKYYKKYLASPSGKKDKLTSKQFVRQFRKKGIWATTLTDRQMKQLRKNSHVTQKLIADIKRKY